MLVSQSVIGYSGSEFEGEHDGGVSFWISLCGGPLPMPEVGTTDPTLAERAPKPTPWILSLEV